LSCAGIGRCARAQIDRRNGPTGPSDIGIPIQIGGVELAPGRFVYCDLDEVIVSSRPLWPAEYFVLSGQIYRSLEGDQET
jgi:regulator of RNase E activity RraA